MCGAPDRRITVDVRETFAFSLSMLTACTFVAYPAQHGKTSGVVTLSAEMFYFTPLLPGPRLEIPVQDIVGIKKASPKGISIRVRDASQEGGERNEKFLPVYERDELFGRLVGTGGKKWTRI
jgi:hypothetical protein